jgi:hypothetical protein
MFDELKPYMQKGRFVFTQQDRLAKVCNAPNDKAGIYVIYGLTKGKRILVYIGSSGEMLQDGTMRIRKGGIKDRLVNGKTAGIRRQIYWPQKMRDENIEALEINWYATHGDDCNDCPMQLEKLLIRKYDPTWNSHYKADK